VERLTEWIDPHLRAFVEYAEGRRIDINMIRDHLAVYEDTGLDPDEISRLKADRDAAVSDLTAIGRQRFECGICVGPDKERCGIDPKANYCGFVWRGIPENERTESCPVCGNSAWSGMICAICGFDSSWKGAAAP